MSSPSFTTPVHGNNDSQLQLVPRSVVKSLVVQHTMLPEILRRARIAFPWMRITPTRVIWLENEIQFRNLPPTPRMMTPQSFHIGEMEGRIGVIETGLSVRESYYSYCRTERMLRKTKFSVYTLSAVCEWVY